MARRRTSSQLATGPPFHITRDPSAARTVTSAANRRGGQNRKPAGNGSLGSRWYWAVPVTQARPVMVGTTAS